MRETPVFPLPVIYIDNSRNVIIGKRNGSFTGMDEKKVFNIVFVAENNGTGVESVKNPDTQLVYTGTQVSISPYVGVNHGRTAGSLQVPAGVTMRIAGEKIALPVFYAGERKRIAIFDCSGRVLRVADVRKQAVDLRKDLHVYVVKVRPMR